MLQSFFKPNIIEVGLDEVGRGSFAGPVVVAAVVFPNDFQTDLIRDSKKLTAKQRERAFKVIVENAIAFSVQAGSVIQINKYGIEEATSIAIKKCLDDIMDTWNVEHIIMDGNRFDNPFPEIPYETIVKGDDKYLSIAAASIIAKVRRDEYMAKLAEIYPHYGWESNAGYHSKGHAEALKEHGVTPYHRTQYVRNFI